MKIQDFVDQNLRYDTTTVGTDPELSQEVQDLLIDLSLLTPPAETPFGARAAAALARFQHQTGCDEPEFLGPQTAAKLLEASEMGTRAPASPISLEALQTTVLKLRPLDSSALEANEKRTLPAGEKLDLTFFETDRKHIKIVLSQPLQDSATWYVYADHVRVFGGEKPVMPEEPKDEKPVITPTIDKPGQVKLSVPYKSQRDNNLNPDGSCNVTSIAMCLEYFKVGRRTSSGQYEDELYQYALDQGLSRHSPQDLAQIVEDYGAKDALDTHATFDQVKAWLSAGNPAVTHGYFTTFGHIVVLAGYDDTGFIVHDPYGEWFADGYDRNDPNGNDEKGKFQHYSYNLIRNTCAYDGEFWVHFISK
jgi:uncharacterized protein YvpB